MAGISWGVGDLLAATKLALDLYQNCYKVAKQAPDEFRQLVRELGAFKGLLKHLHDDVHSDQSFEKRLDGARQESLKRCLAQSLDTLRQLQSLLAKYRELMLRDGLQFWVRAKWVWKQNELIELKEKIKAHTYTIQLCLTTISNASLARIEAAMAKALELQEAAQEESNELTPLTKSALSRTGYLEPDVFSPSQRQSTSSTLVDRHGAASNDPLSASDEEGSVFGISVTSFPSPRKSSIPVPKKSSQRSPLAYVQDSSVLIPSPPSTDSGFRDGLKNRSASDVSSRDADFGFSARTSDLADVVADAMQELSMIRQKEQSSKPLKIRPQDPVHKPSESLKKYFSADASDEMQYRKLNTRDWLRVATWWLLKSSFRMQASEGQGSIVTRESITTSTDSKSPASQAYVDLLKASWILYEILLKDNNLTSLQTDENRKLFHSLSNGIRDELEIFRPVGIPDQEALEKQNINCRIWENTQPEEEAYDDDELLLPHDHGRWITVEEDNAGEDDEEVLFRTFVDAAIGGKKRHVRSKGAPYMLILSTKHGESEPKVTLCNQSGSLGVSRDFTTHDLLEGTGPASPISGMAPIRSVQSYGLEFPLLQVAIGFTNEEDLQNFMAIPQAYFKAVTRREPRQLNHAAERLLFRGSVETVEQLQPSSMALASERDRWTSCDLRVLETVGNTGWRTTRRLVLSSSAGEETPWCREFFCPMSWVQVNQEGLARQVVVRWSDCGREKQRNDGNYHPRFDYIYDPQRPNLAFRFLFHNQDDASAFVETVLTLSNPRLHAWASSVSSGVIYSISDGEPSPKEYRAVQVVHRNVEWKYSEVCYIYGETDYAYDHSARQVRLPEAHQVDYISTHVDKLYKPTAPPQFSHCQKKVQSTTINFNDEVSAQAFMSALSSGYELLFSRRALYVTTKAPSRFTSTRSNKGAAEVQLWRQGNTTRLVSRWGDVVEDKWLTMTVPKEGVNSARDSNRASLPGVYYERGKLIAMVGLVARHPREERGRMSGCVTVVFESSKDREEFVAVVEQREPVRQTEEMSDLMDMLR